MRSSSPRPSTLMPGASLRAQRRTQSRPVLRPVQDPLVRGRVEDFRRELAELCARHRMGVISAQQSGSLMIVPESVASRQELERAQAMEMSE